MDGREHRPLFPESFVGASIDQIVLHAAALDPVERTAFLERLGKEAPELLQRAQGFLIAASDVSVSFLETPASDLLAPEPADAADTRSPISGGERYEVEKLLGSGGMAEVWKAHDRQLDRPVALKLLFDDLPDHAALCLREARAQARVRHNHVLEVYDTGTLDGRPFISLRYTHGTTLLEAAEELPLESQVALLVQVAEGLHAAHAMGLVHRDVKPSNVLVEEGDDGTLHAWVTDFGIASVLRSGDSLTGDRLVGTAHYLPPERLVRDGTVDRRADIWSLGVTMYRLFTGELPFDHTMVPELLLRIRDQDPKPPRELAPSLPEDLQAIVWKCLAKDPGLRYPSARALAEDLQRFLAGDVVEAHTATWEYRVTRFIVRNRALVKLGGIASVLLTISLGVAALLGFQAMRANARVELRQGQAEELIDFMLVDLRKKLEPVGRLELLDDVDEQAMSYFLSMPENELDREELARYARSLHQIGDVRMRRGRWQEASEAFAEALELHRSLADRFPGDQQLFDLGQSFFWVGYVRWELGETESALQAFEEYRTVSRELVEREPSRSDWQLELAYAESNLGTVSLELGELETSRRHFETSLSIRQELLATSPEDSELVLGTARAHNSLAITLEALGKPAATRSHLEKDLELKKLLVDKNPDHATFRDSLAVSHNYLGAWMGRYGAWAEAKEHLEHAAEIHEQLWRNDNSNADLRYKLALDRGALGLVLLGLGEEDEALQVMPWACETLDELVGEGPSSHHWRRDLGGSLNYLAVARLSTGDLQGARESAEAALAAFSALGTAAVTDRLVARRISESHLLLGEAALRRGEDERAREHWREAEELLEPFVEISDYRLLPPRARLALRLGTSPASPSPHELLVAQGFCSPMYRELCPP